MGVDTFSIVFVAVVSGLDGEWALRWLHFFLLICPNYLKGVCTVYVP